VQVLAVLHGKKDLNIEFRKDLDLNPGKIIQILDEPVMPENCEFWGYTIEIEGCELIRILD
jgi:hypothetical protein